MIVKVLHIVFSIIPLLTIMFYDTLWNKYLINFERINVLVNYKYGDDVDKKYNPEVIWGIFIISEIISVLLIKRYIDNASDFTTIALFLVKMVLTQYVHEEFKIKNERYFFKILTDEIAKDLREEEILWFSDEKLKYVVNEKITTIKCRRRKFETRREGRIFEIRYYLSVKKYNFYRLKVDRETREEKIERIKKIWSNMQQL